MVNLPTTRRRAFTLIELLVVISIIALLIGILLPALGAARQSAQGAGCLANVRSTAQAVNAHVADYQGAYPGPSTTGGNVNPTLATAATKPLQNFDWISPLMGDLIGLPNDPTERLREMFDNEFRCPSNQEVYPEGTAFGDLNPGADLAVSSYSSPTPLHVVSRSSARSGDVFIRSWINSEVEIPTNFRPSIDSIGSPSARVWAMDGSRHVNQSDGVITYNSAGFQIDGGNFASWGPALSKIVRNGNPYKRDSEQQIKNSKRFAYRHQGENMNMAFFDGHAETMDVQESRRVGHYFPGGSTVRNIGDLDDDSVQVGSVIQ